MYDDNIALLLIDVQNGFMPEGELPVIGGDDIVPVINKIIGKYRLVVASQDWHPSSHLSFAANHKGKNIFDVIDLDGLEQVLWPVHCVAGSVGADFHPQLIQDQISAIFRKGMDPLVDSYSAFYDNGRRFNTGLASYLKFHQIKHLHIVGLAADYCVYYSIKDALDAGFGVSLITNATRAISEESFVKQQSELAKHHNFNVIVA